MNEQKRFLANARNDNRKSFQTLSKGFTRESIELIVGLPDPINLRFYEYKPLGSL